jgi:serine/threonine protein kinase
VYIGAFGNVRVGWMKSNKNNKYAIKTMKKKEIIKSKHVDHIENEKNILEKITHPFVVKKLLLTAIILILIIYSLIIMDSFRMKDTYTS